MARRKRADPGRDILNLIGQHAQDSAKQTLPQMDTGTVLKVDDGTDGTIVQLDNMQGVATDCLLLGAHAPHVGDRVMVLVNQEEFWIIGGIQGQASGDSSGIPSTSLFQTGMMMMWPTDTPPSGWLVCNGLSQLTADYPALSALLRPIFGGPNAASFYLPPFPGRAPIGAGTGDATDATLHTLASKTGTEGAKLTNVGQMPSHHHGSATAGLISPPTITTGAPSPNTSDLNVAANTGAPSPNTSDGPSTPSTGAGTAHSHDPIGGVTYHLGTGGIANRISASLSGGGGVTTIASPAILTDEASHTHPMQSHTHTMANHVHAAPQHTHTMANHTHSSTMPSHDHTITAQGNSDSHPNMQPSLTVHFIIKT